jgi:hypothetical protein
MPSIPQSLLWISLVVLWLFVLVPMLISKRDAVRRTSDVALATRVLNGATSIRKLRRGAPAAGHRSDPDWQPPPDFVDDADDADNEFDDDDEPAPSGVVVARFADVSEPEPDYLDVDIVEEDSGALPVGSSAAEQEPEHLEHEEHSEEPEPEPEDVAPEPEGVAPEPEDVAPEPEDVAPEPEDIAPESEEVEAKYAAEEDPEPDGSADEYEYVEDTSGLESPEDPPTTITPSATRRRRHDAQTLAALSARKYRFRKRVVAVMALMLALSALAAYAVWPAGWWLCGGIGVVTVLYLVYLRRQTRIEEQLRRRRLQRMARSRLGVQNTEDRTFDVVPSRLRRPGAVVMEIDDEDPVFEHLESASAPEEYHLSKAAGQ